MKTPPNDRTHSFHLEDVEKYGSIEKALIMKELYNMSTYKIRTGKKPWVYYSANALSLKFPYMNERSLQRWLVELEDDGHLDSDSTMNKVKYDKTKWYCPKSLRQNGEWEGQNGGQSGQNGEPIPSLSTSLSTARTPASQKNSEPEEDDIELVPEEDTVPYKAFGKRKVAIDGQPYPSPGSRNYRTNPRALGTDLRTRKSNPREVSKLGKDLQDTLKDWANISSLDGDYNDRDTEDFILLFKADLLRFNYTTEELDPPTVVREFKALLEKIKDPFHQKNLTSMSYLKRNFQRILKDVDN